MIGKFIIPVINTETGNFDYKGNICREEYENMVSENFIKNNSRIQSLADSMRYGTDFDFGKRTIIRGNKENDITLCICEALFLDSKKNDYDTCNLEKYAENQKMSIILVNINPNTLEQDAESDLRYWIADCRKILDDNELNDKTKLEVLPKMSFCIETEDKKMYKLQNCKMFEDYSDKKYPFYFALIIEKITKEN